MKQLLITWQRLINTQGNTCPRCQGTGEAVERAVERLRLTLEPLGVSPVLERHELDEATFRDQPSESNRIWIAGKPLEDWIEGQTGSSPCCNECGDNECRTVEVEGTVHEVIPEDLLVRAGLKAGLSLLESGSQKASPIAGDARPACCRGGGCC